MLHVVDADLLLFDGPLALCPPIPRPGDEIIHEQRRMRVEGIRHEYRADHVEISVLA
jgi:hypothetical protein